VICFAAPAANFLKRDFSSVSKRAFPGFLVDFFVADLPSKKRYLYTQESTRVLSIGVVTAMIDALWRVLSSSNKVIWVLGHCWLNTQHIHTYEWDSLFVQSCLLSTVTVTPSNSDYVNTSASLQRFWLIHTTPSRRSRVRFFAFVPRHTTAEK